MLDTLSKILNIILVILTSCLYFENKRLKKYDAEKELKIKKAELTKLNNNYLERTMGAGSYDYKISIADRKKEEYEYNCQINCLDAEIERLEKILKDKNK